MQSEIAHRMHTFQSIDMRNECSALAYNAAHSRAMLMLSEHMAGSCKVAMPETIWLFDEALADAYGQSVDK